MVYLRALLIKLVLILIKVSQVMVAMVMIMMIRRRVKINKKIKMINKNDSVIEYMINIVIDFGVTF